MEVVNRSMVKVENEPGSLTLTHGLQEWIFSESCVSFEEECTIEGWAGYCTENFKIHSKIWMIP